MRKIYLCGLILAFTLAAAGMALAEAKSEVTPDAAVKMLTEGNNRFVTGHESHPNLAKARRQQTAEKGQTGASAIFLWSGMRATSPPKPISAPSNMRWII